MGRLALGRWGRLASVGALLALAGCAQSGPPCDYNFREQGFGSTLASVATNEYQRCTDHLSAQLTELQVQVAAAKRNAAKLEKAAAQSDARQRAAMQDLARLNRASDEQVAKLNQLRADVSKDRKRVAELIAEKQELEERKRAASTKAIAGVDAALAEEIAALELEQQVLDQQINLEIAS